jgi:hypothetical protein
VVRSLIIEFAIPRHIIDFFVEDMMQENFEGVWEVGEVREMLAKRVRSRNVTLD